MKLWLDKRCRDDIWGSFRVCNFEDTIMRMRSTSQDSCDSYCSAEIMSSLHVEVNSIRRIFRYSLHIYVYLNDCDM